MYDMLDAGHLESLIREIIKHSVHSITLSVVSTEAIPHLNSREGVVRNELTPWDGVVRGHYD